MGSVGSSRSTDSTIGFLHTDLGGKGKRVFRLGLSASYWPGKKVVHRAFDSGVNFFFCYGFDYQMTSVLRDLFRRRRDEIIVSTGAYNLFWGYPNLQRTLEKRLRQLGTDFLDLFLLLGVMKPEHFPDSIRETLMRLRSDGKVGSIGISTHDRQLAGKLAAEGDLDILMIRYNAAHRGAEKDIFPRLVERRRPSIIAYTATRWGQLLKRPRNWPDGGRIPSAGLCYRFVLSHPTVDVCLTAPRNLRQFEANLSALQQGPLDEDEMAFMLKFGDAVYRGRKWFP